MRVSSIRVEVVNCNIVLTRPFLHGSIPYLCLGTRVWSAGVAPSSSHADFGEDGAQGTPLLLLDPESGPRTPASRWDLIKAELSCRAYWWELVQLASTAQDGPAASSVDLGSRGMVVNAQGQRNSGIGLGKEQHHGAIDMAHRATVCCFMLGHRHRLSVTQCQAVLQHPRTAEQLTGRQKLKRRRSDPRDSGDKEDSMSDLEADPAPEQGQAELLTHAIGLAKRIGPSQ